MVKDQCKNFIDWVSKAVKKNKGITMKKGSFTLERLLGCEVIYNGVNFMVTSIFDTSTGRHLILHNGTELSYVSDPKLLTFFTEDGDELTFDEYVELYYGEKHESN